MTHSAHRYSIRGLAAAAPALLTAGLPAQTIDWNRRVVEVAVTPSAAAGSIYDITVIWEVVLGQATIPLDLSLGVQLLVNSAPAGTQFHQVGIDPGPIAACADNKQDCAGNCGSGTLDGQDLVLICFLKGDCNAVTCNCECGFYRSAVFPGVAIAAGDQITAMLVPATGALPELDQSDDSRSVAFAGSPIFWNRRLDAVGLAAGGEYEVAIAWDVAVSGLTGEADLSTVIDVAVDGTTIASFTACGDQITIPPTNFCGGCTGQTCGTAHCGGGSTPMSCGIVESPLMDFCGCASDTYGVVVPLLIPVCAHCEIEVLLRPAPGALPELAAFASDDAMSFVVCPWDCGDNNGSVGIVDFLGLLSQWGQAGGSCDLDGGGVGITDFLALLAEWGPC